MANVAFVAIIGCSFFSGGLQSPVLPWFTLIPVVAAVLLLGYSVGALVWFLVCFVISVSYGTASLQGYQFPVLYRLEYATAISMVCTGGLVAVLDSRKELEHLVRSQEGWPQRSLANAARKA